MLANPEFNWKKQPQIHVWRKKSKGGETSVELENYDSTECITLFEEALRNNEVLLSTANRELSITIHFGLCW